MSCERCGAPLTAGETCCPQCRAAVRGAPPLPGLPIPEEIIQETREFVGRVWVLDEVAAWQSAGPERVLLITGNPGSGKSMLASWLAGGGPPPDDAPAAAAWQQVVARWSAAHFCVGADQAGSIDPIGFSKRLAAQLAQQFPGYAQALTRAREPGTAVTVSQKAGTNLGTMVGAYIESFVVNNSNPHDTFNRLVRDPLAELAKSCPGLAVYILVDALDEALAYPAPNIVTLLRGINDLPPGVRLCVTSRNDSRVTDGLPAARRLDLSDPAHARQNAEDVRTYVRRRLARIGAAEAEAEAAIAEAAAGNFMYAHFVLDEIASGRRSAAGMGPLPPRLFDLYKDYLQRLLPGSDDFRPRGLWPATYQPLLGSLSVAIPAAPLDRLSRWMGKQAARVPLLLDHVQPLTQYDASGPGGYRLFHRSMNDFLATRELEGDGAPDLNPYYTPPAEQHARICRYYLDTYAGFWQECDEYGLRRLGAHLRARLTLDLPPKERRRAAEELYGLALDAGFRAAQLAKLGDAQASLNDVRLAVDVAVQLNDVSRVLELAGVYRDITRTASITRAIFDDVQRGDLRTAIQRASFFGLSPRPRGRWAEVVQLYLASEAALAGKVDLVHELFASAGEVPGPWSSPLADALRAHIARILARGETGRTAEEWLAELAPGDDPRQLLAAYPVAQPPDASLRQARVEELRARLDGYRALVNEPPSPEGATSSFFALETDLGALTGTLHELLAGLGSDPACRQGVDDMLAIVAANSYPRYRDLGLVGLGIVCLAWPDVDSVRGRLQSLLAAALDRDGVLFTLDLPSILEAEATWRRAGDTLPGLREVREYIAQAAAGDDRWGSALRAGSARAAALFWQGETRQAFDELAAATRRERGFAGYGTLSMLALAGRCFEFGDPARAMQPTWGREQNATLPDIARRIAGRVRDEVLRRERLALVDAYEQWAAADAPDLVALHNKLSTVPDPDVRRAYKDLAGARWATPGHRDEASLAGLIPVVLHDAMTLDALLARWLGPRLRRLSDTDLADAIRLCARYLLDQRPWDTGSPPR